MVEARLHFEFCAEIYKEQMRAGRRFLHKHPLTATSWQEQCMMDLLADHRTIFVISDLCQFGLTTIDKSGEKRPAMKPTRFLTISKPIAVRLSKRCPRKHKHAVLLGGRAAAAAEYTSKLCVEILQGVQGQFERSYRRPALRLIPTVHYLLPGDQTVTVVYHICIDPQGLNITLHDMLHLCVSYV